MYAPVFPLCFGLWPFVPVNASANSLVARQLGEANDAHMCRGRLTETHVMTPTLFNTFHATNIPMGTWTVVAE